MDPVDLAIFSALRLFFGLVLSAYTAYLGLRIFDALTPNIEEWELLKKGNLAVGIFYAFVMLSFVLLNHFALLDFLASLAPGVDLVIIVVTFLNFVLSLFLSAGVLFFSFNLINYLTPDIDELKELNKGNVAVALISGLALFTISVFLTFVVAWILGRLAALEAQFL